MFSDQSVNLQSGNSLCVKTLTVGMLANGVGKKWKTKWHRYGLSNLQKGDFDGFKFIVNDLLESHAPMKEKYIRRNQALFMNKNIRKAITVWTQLLDKFGKN